METGMETEVREEVKSGHFHGWLSCLPAGARGGQAAAWREALVVPARYCRRELGGRTPLVLSGRYSCTVMAAGALGQAPDLWDSSTLSADG